VAADSSLVGLRRDHRRTYAPHHRAAPNRCHEVEADLPISGVWLLDWLYRETLGVGASRAALTALADRGMERHDNGFHGASPALRRLNEVGISMMLP
jgi:hypothetical protein